MDTSTPSGEFLEKIHLSNEQITKVLSKLFEYRWVIITEHLPGNDKTAIPNLDKVHGTDMRLMRNSGVYLDLPPFSIPARQLTVILEVPGHGFAGGIAEPGVIRTLLYRPQS